MSFPSNPSVNQLHTVSDNGWIYDGYGWEKIDAGITFASGATGYIQYNDGYHGFTSNANFRFDGTNVVLTSPVHLDGDILGGVHHYAHNTSGVGISRGYPVYITGMDGASTIMRIAKADASNPSTMPAVGLAETDIANGDTSQVIMFGTLLQVNTSGYSTNQTLYVAPGGGLTGTRPTSPSHLVQNIGKVGRVHSNSGSMIVMGPGRSNDIPNVIDGGTY